MNWPVEFQLAAGGFDWPRVRSLADEYVAHLRADAKPAGRSERTAILEILRNNRRYDEIADVVDALLSQGIDDPALRRHHAQALVERGNPAAALLTFQAIAENPRASADERVEARGSAGRCYKELFLATADPARRREFLHRALSAYGDSYREDRSNYWSGVNLIALLTRSTVDGIDLPSGESQSDVTGIATDILEVVESAAPGDAWAQATAVEVYHALGRTEEMIAQLETFLTLAQPSAFAINSLLRQLTDVWMLTADAPPGDTVLAQLRSELLTRSGGVVTVGPNELSNERLEKLSTPSLEKVFGAERFVTLRWYLNGLARCQAVARIETVSEAPVGTGFLVSGKSLHPGLPDRVLMTNGHVVPETLHADGAVVAFHGMPRGDAITPRARVVRQLWSDSSERGHLDTTLLELDRVPEGVDPVPISTRTPVIDDAPERAYVIGHPGGLESPQFSLQDNLLLAVNDSLLHYRTPTEPGSSGSPVFDENWDLIAIHHAGSAEMARIDGRPGSYSANEGILISAIVNRLRESVTS